MEVEVEVDGKDVWTAPVDVVSRKIIQTTPTINFTQNNNLKMCWFEISIPEVIKIVLWISAYVSVFIWISPYCRFALVDWIHTKLGELTHFQIRRAYFFISHSYLLLKKRKNLDYVIFKIFSSWNRRSFIFHVLNWLKSELALLTSTPHPTNETSQV